MHRWRLYRQCWRLIANARMRWFVERFVLRSHAFSFANCALFVAIESFGFATFWFIEEKKTEKSVPETGLFDFRTDWTCHLHARFTRNTRKINAPAKKKRINRYRFVCCSLTIEIVVILANLPLHECMSAVRAQWSTLQSGSTSIEHLRNWFGAQWNAESTHSIIRQGWIFNLLV